MKKISIAIDGPAGSGKSTIAKMISKELNILYIDTGAMYRGFAYYLLKKGIDTKGEKEILSQLDSLEMEVVFEDGHQNIFINDKNITSKLRTPEVSIGASNVAMHLCVREKLVKLQRKIAGENGVIMDGRDIGSHVLPNAQLKIYLNASIEERAKRRFNESYSKESVNLDEIKKSIQVRDENDRNRENSPLKKVADAVEIDTSNLSIGEVADKIINLYKTIEIGNE